MSKKIYLVMGQTGEFDDYVEWIYKAYTTKKKALLIMNDLNKWLEDNNCLLNHCSHNLDYWEPREKLREFDPGAHLDYTGANYYLIPIDLEE